jgi:DNA polymerase III sliding clamp (beta) subunit (PCNA family)
MLVIQETNNHFELTTLPVDDFPLIKKGKKLGTFLIKKQKLLTAIQNTIPCVSLDDTRKALHGINIENNNINTILTATDGKKLITQTSKSLNIFETYMF